jgi:alanine or glycine:cation symporter, AGCS family
MSLTMSINDTLAYAGNALFGWPMMVIVIGMGSVATVMLYFVQIRYFIAAWRMVLFPSKDFKEIEVKTTASTQDQITPFQAFINALGTSTGNGSIAGIATAIAVGGPGAAFWMLIFGVFGLVLRFAEVYLATCFTGQYSFKGVTGGPIVYLSRMPAGTFLAYAFAFLMLLYGLTSGNVMQVNAIALGIASTWQVPLWITAIALGLFLTYVMLGGAQRVIKISDAIVPIKVALFIVSSLIVLIYHYAEIIPAIKLIFLSALDAQAVGGAVAGISMQVAMRQGFARPLNAHEAGLGVAGVLFGATGSKHPMNDSIMSMVGVFISNYVICFMVALTVIATGVWNNGLQSTPLTISAFNTVFGVYGGWVVTLCAAGFGLGVLVAFAFVTRQMWLFLTGGRWTLLFNVLYVVIACVGTMVTPDLIWSTNDLVNGSLLLMNLAAIGYYLPTMRRAVASYRFANNNMIKG